MRADRLLSLLMLLQVKGQTTARELAKRLEVSERTIYRDIEALSMAGVPVYAERGPGGGCTLSEGYRSGLTGLTEAEVRTLFMPGTTRLLADLGVNQALDAALLKLQAALSKTQRSNVEHMCQRLYVDATSWFLAEQSSPFLQTLREAVLGDLRLRLLYRKQRGEVSERTVDPLGLVAKAGCWYMVALSRGELRVFRVSRVRGAEILDEPAQRPAHFDLESFWLNWCNAFRHQLPAYTVTLRCSPDLLSYLPQIMGEGMHQLIEEAGPSDIEGWLLLTLHFENFPGALRSILGFGNDVEVLEPLELRQAVIANVRATVNLYHNDSL